MPNCEQFWLQVRTRLPKVWHAVERIQHGWARHDELDAVIAVHWLLAVNGSAKERRDGTVENEEECLKASPFCPPSGWTITYDPMALDFYGILRSELGV